MAKTLQFRRGTTAEVGAITGAEGELFVDLNKNSVVVMDGSTQGGQTLQPELVSGTNIKTVNGTSVLGEGNIDLSTNLTLVENELRYTNIDGTVQTIDLSAYLDDTTNTISSGVLDGNTGTITFTREDSTTFAVDVSALYDDTNLVTSVNGNTGAVTVQETLVSGTNIKTVNGTSVLGSGDIEISGGGGSLSELSGTTIPTNIESIEGFSALLYKTPLAAFSGSTITGNRAMESWTQHIDSGDGHIINVLPQGASYDSDMLAALTPIVLPKQFSMYMLSTNQHEFTTTVTQIEHPSGILNLQSTNISSSPLNLNTDTDESSTTTDWVIWTQSFSDFNMVRGANFYAGPLAGILTINWDGGTTTLDISNATINMYPEQSFSGYFSTKITGATVISGATTPPASPVTSVVEKYSGNYFRFTVSDPISSIPAYYNLDSDGVSNTGSTKAIAIFDETPELRANPLIRVTTPERGVFTKSSQPYWVPEVIISEEARLRIEGGVHSYSDLGNNFKVVKFFGDSDEFFNEKIITSSRNFKKLTGQFAPNHGQLDFTLGGKTTDATPVFITTDPLTNPNGSATADPAGGLEWDWDYSSISVIVKAFVTAKDPYPVFVSDDDFKTFEILTEIKYDGSNIQVNEISNTSAIGGSASWDAEVTYSGGFVNSPPDLAIGVKVTGQAGKELYWTAKVEVLITQGVY